MVKQLAIHFIKWFNLLLHDGSDVDSQLLSEDSLSQYKADHRAHHARIYYLSERCTMKKPYKAVEDLYEKKAVPFCDFVIKSNLTPDESMQAIHKLEQKGYVKQHHGESVVAMTLSGLKAGRSKVLSALK